MARYDTSSIAVSIRPDDPPQIIHLFTGLRIAQLTYLPSGPIAGKVIGASMMDLRPGYDDMVIFFLAPDRPSLHVRVAAPMAETSNPNNLLLAV